MRLETKRNNGRGGSIFPSSSLSAATDAMKRLNKNGDFYSGTYIEESFTDSMEKITKRWNWNGKEFIPAVM